MPSAADPDRELAIRVHRGISAGVIDPGEFTALTSIEQGLRVQLEVLDLRRDEGDSLVGWKAGLTSGRSRDRMGPGFRPFGHLLKRRTFPSGSVIAPPPGRLAIEPELVFVIGRALRGDPDPSLVADSIAAVIPAFELLQYRAPDPVPHPVAVAENLAHWGIVLGDPVPWTSTAAAVRMRLLRSQVPVATAGPDYAIDEPTRSIAALCSLLDRFGLGIEPGQYVLTGSFAIAELDAPSTWRAEFAGIGAVELQLDEHADQWIG